MLVPGGFFITSIPGIRILGWFSNVFSFKLSIMNKYLSNRLKFVFILLLIPVLAPAIEIDDSILVCREVQPAVKKAQCYDQAIDRYLGRTTEGETAAIPSMTNQVKSPPVTQDRQESQVSQENLFGKSDREAARIALQDRMDEKKLDLLEARVGEVSRDNLGRLIIVLDNKQTWIQTDYTDLNLHQGEEIEIKRTFMNAYMLEKKSGSRRIRVKRNN